LHSSTLYKQLDNMNQKFLTMTLKQKSQLLCYPYTQKADVPSWQPGPALCHARYIPSTTLKLC
jgi:hypothetical protein